MRVYEGETYCWSRSSSARARGPGNSVRICGTVSRSNCHMGYLQTRFSTRGPFDGHGQPLGHLDLSAVVDRPGDLVRNCLDQAGGGWMAVAAALDAAERQMDLGTDARQVHIA